MKILGLDLLVMDNYLIYKYNKNYFSIPQIMEINIGEKKIGNNNLIYFIAEIDVNHCVFQGSVLSTVPKAFKGLHL